MATGFEALGAVSAVFQVISFSGEVIALCKKVYDGKPTANDDLEGHVTHMSEAISRVEDRCKTLQTCQQSTGMEMKLKEIAEACRVSAQELQTEVRFVTGMQTKGNVIKALRSVLRASSHRKRIERLELALSRHRQVMETEMLTLICSQGDAQRIKQGTSFHALANDVQTLVVHIAQGYIKLEDLVRIEHQATRDMMIRQTSATQEALRNHIATEAQQKEFLQSLRSPEMKKRYNDLMDSSEATFSRVFASYDRMTKDDDDGASVSSLEGDQSDASDKSFNSETSSNPEDEYIDEAWASFINWLRSNTSLFCIQGKPGSGKSTLVKFIIDNPNTESLLCHHSQETSILSHFFWKIGASSQNSVKGLLCSLLYQMLSGNQDLLEVAMGRCDHESHRHYHDWSESSLRLMLFCLLERIGCSLCIFIDGLDEIRDSDGVSKLTKLIEDILVFPGIKICVTSRPETLVVNWLAKRPVSSILLEDLTSTEMKLYLRHNLRSVCSENTISDRTYHLLIHGLVEKAQGVFLWIYLSLRSLKIGIQSGDADSMLLQRMEGLPGDLEQLYSDMWKRMSDNNPPYRDTAVKYFQYTLQRPQRTWACYSVEKMDRMIITQPTLGQIMCAETPALQHAILEKGGTFDRATIKYECMKTKRAIETRCAGMLEVKPAIAVDEDSLLNDELSLMWSGVAFIHRTAHDFLTDTEAGSAIMQRQSTSETELAMRLLKGILAVFCVLHSQTEKCGPLTMVLEQANELAEKYGPKGLQEVISVFPLLERLYKNGTVSTIHWPLPAPRFLGVLARYARFHDFVTAAIQSPALEANPTNILRDALSLSPAWIFSSDRELVFPSLDLIQQLLAMGASVHTNGFNRRYSFGIGLKYEPLVCIDTIFANIIETGLLSLNPNTLVSEVADFAPLFIDCVLAMENSCPDFDSPMLVHINVDREYGAIRFDELLQTEAAAPLSSQRFALLIEAKLSFVLSYVLAVFKPFYHGAAVSKVEELFHRLDRPTPKLRFVISSTEHQPTLYERVECGQSYLEIMEILFRTDHRPEKSPTKKADANNILQANRIWSLIRTLDLTVTDVETACISLANEELGIRTYPQARITPPNSWLEHHELNPDYAFPRILEELRTLSADNTNSL